jgi:hypothetical protein
MVLAMTRSTSGQLISRVAALSCSENASGSGADSVAARSSSCTAIPASMKIRRKGPSCGEMTLTFAPGRSARWRASSKMNHGAPSRFKLCVATSTHSGRLSVTSVVGAVSTGCCRRRAGASARYCAHAALVAAMSAVRSPLGMWWRRAAPWSAHHARANVRRERGGSETSAPAMNRGMKRCAKTKCFSPLSNSAKTLSRAGELWLAGRST